MTSGSSTATSASKSPPRSAARKASRRRAGARDRRRHGGGAPHAAARAAGELPRRRRRAPDDRRDLVEGHANMSCSTNASRSAGSSVSSTTSSARPTESASSASCSGSMPALLAIGSGTSSSSGSSRRALRERSMSRHTRATTVVSQPPRLSTPLVSARLSRSQASCTASSASLERAEHPVGDRRADGRGSPRIVPPAIVFVPSVTFPRRVRHSSDERTSTM